ncbi:MAG TPA: M4 family metallopeptidase [Anaerolineales bacterium]|nr:M4 family metallopeptidase [Anaerolineales bacterium]
MCHRHPIHCIIPPHMLDEITKSGTDSQREKAEETMAISNRIRIQRTSRDLTARMAAIPVTAQKQRNVYDAKNGSQLPGTLVRTEGDPPSSDVAVNEAYDGSGVTYDLFKDIYGRNSIDNKGMPLDSTVHYLQGYDNAFWNGKQMVYGDGDEDLPPAQRLFNRFTAALDVIGHELTHGVTQFEANLVYSQQPGALNESMSDVFGSLVKQRLRGQLTNEADWIVGEGLFTSNVNGVGIRSMKAPGTAYNDPVLGKDPQPAHMRDYVNTIQDNGGVHINSGIPNHAFYLASMEMGGFAWEKMGMVWYKTLTDKLSRNSNFQDAANYTFTTAGELFGQNSLEQMAVRKGWEDVGITVGAPPQEGCFNAALRAVGLR